MPPCLTLPAPKPAANKSLAPRPWPRARAKSSCLPVSVLVLTVGMLSCAEAWAMDYRAVFTAPPRKIPSDCSVDAPLLGNGDTLVALGGTPDKLQFYINKNDLWVMRAADGSQPMPLARLDLDFPALQGATYRVEQDLRHAITTGLFEKEGKKLSLEAGVAATENLLWIKLAAQGGPIQGRASLHLPGRKEAVKGDVAGDVQVVERRFEKDVTVPPCAPAARCWFRRN